MFYQCFIVVLRVFKCDLRCLQEYFQVFLKLVSWMFQISLKFVSSEFWRVYIMFKGYFNVSRIVQARLKDVSYFYRCFQVFLAQTMRLTWEFCYMTQTILGLLSVACYLRFAIGNLLFMFFFWDLQLLARKLLSFATIVRLAIFLLQKSFYFIKTNEIT